MSFTSNKQAAIKKKTLKKNYIIVEEKMLLQNMRVINWKNSVVLEFLLRASSKFSLEYYGGICICKQVADDDYLISSCIIVFMLQTKYYFLQFLRIRLENGK